MPITEHETRNGLSFKSWLHEVDLIVLGRFGLGVRDFADFPSYDTWEAGTEPKDAIEVIAEYDEILAAMIEELGESE
jgi:hypothetical protein